MLFLKLCRQRVLIVCCCVCRKYTLLLFDIGGCCQGRIQKFLVERDGWLHWHSPCPWCRSLTTRCSALLTMRWLLASYRRFHIIQTLTESLPVFIALMKCTLFKSDCCIYSVLLSDCSFQTVSCVHTGVNTVEINTEAARGDITEYPPPDDEPNAGMFGFLCCYILCIYLVLA